MRTTISLAVPDTEAKKAKRLAKARGFSTLSDYLRFLLAQDDQTFISEDELIARAQGAAMMHQKGKLVRARSLADFLK